MPSFATRMKCPERPAPHPKVDGTGGSLSRHRGRAAIVKIARDHAESDMPTRLMIDQRGGEIRDLVALLGDRGRAYACAIESRCACCFCLMMRVGCRVGGSSENPVVRRVRARRSFM